MASLSLITEHGWYFTLRIMRPDQVVSTLFTFEVLKQCDQMVVGIDNIHRQCMFLVKKIKIENGSKKIFVIIPKCAKIMNVFFCE